VLLLFFLSLPLFAQEDPTKELQKALQGFMLLLQESQKSLQELSQTDQKPIPEEKNGFSLYYKRVQNAAKVEKRNDLLIKTQIGYKFLREKE
jgi:phosphopantothenoylcysteine synthetase/decarboxylase